MSSSCGAREDGIMLGEALVFGTWRHTTLLEILPLRICSCAIFEEQGERAHFMNKSRGKLEL